jgi:hypothetical protein
MKVIPLWCDGKGIDLFTKRDSSYNIKKLFVKFCQAGLSTLPDNRRGSRMIQPIINLFKLIRIMKERGNRPLFRRSRKQVLDIVFCRNDINRKNPVSALFYWLGVLKGLDMLVWRLETFGFLHLPESAEADRARLNRYIEL